MIKEPNTWKNPASHYLKVINDPWYMNKVRWDSVIIALT